MDHQTFVDHVAMPCCVMSVEKTDAGTCGEIRIVAANQAYRRIMGPAYYDGMPYYELVPKDNKFEDFCFRAAILKQRMHAYVETKALNTWTDQTLIPLDSESETLGYCQFIFEFTAAAEADRMATVPADIAEAVIKACIMLSGMEDIHESVGGVLDDIVRFSGAQGCRVMLVDHEKKEAVVFCERDRKDAWRRNAGEDDAIRYELIRSWEAVIGVSNAVIVKDEQDIADIRAVNPLWADSLRAHDVKSLVLLPLRQAKHVIGYLYVVNFDVSKVVEVKEMAELMSFFLGAEISNHLLMNKLEVLSQSDALTGVYNRRAMLNCMKRLERCCGTPFGVVNIDLNGLKVVNDLDGHDAGDRLLVRSGEILRSIFDQDNLFRTGGDEFVVISGGIGQDAFQEKVRRLRDVMERESAVSFAVGAYWSDGSTDMRTAFRLADERMYADKQAFYALHPEQRR